MANLVFDRTQQDLDHAEAMVQKVQAKGMGSLTDQEKAEYFQGLKGCYNITDLNRVEQEARRLDALLLSYGYKADTATKTDWQLGDIFDSANQERYLANIEKLKTAFCVLETTPQTPPSVSSFDKANDLERILFDLDMIIGWMVESFLYSGEIYSGEVR